jgi:tryptophan aminotransferase
MQLEQTPGMISMLVGKPNPSLFPITSISVTIRSPTADGSVEKVVDIQGTELQEALQYGATQGLPNMHRWFKRLQVIAHDRAPGPDWELAIGSGSQDLLYKVS